MIFKTRTNEFDDTDIIKIETDIILKDRNGNVIEVNTPRPEYSSEIFSKGKRR